MQLDLKKSIFMLILSLSIEIIISDVSWDGKVDNGIFGMLTAMTRKDGSVLYLCFVPVL